MRHAVLLVLVLALAGAAEPDPAALLPEGATASVRTIDLARSRTRWAETPYPRLLATGWGRVAITEWSGRIDRAAPGLAASLATITALAAAATTPDAGEPRWLVAASGDEALGAALAAGALPGGAARAPGLAVWSHDGAMPAPRPVPPPLDPLADVELRLAPASGPAVTAALTLDAAGLRERGAVAPTAIAAAWAAATVRWADPAELAALPATTLWAATWTAEPAALALVPANATAEDLLAGLGLPGLGATLRGLDGPCTLAVSEGAPFPTATLALAMAEAPARAWIAALAARLNLAVAADGTAAGFAALLPMAAGWLDDGGGRNRLVVTTDPGGLDAWRRRQPGFAALPGIGETLAAPPPRCLLLAAGRGGASWAALAQLALPALLAMGAPQAVTLPRDLAAAGDRGWLHAVLRPDGGLEWDAGGLFGGPAGVLAAGGIAIPATLWLDAQLAREREPPAPAPPAPDQPPVF